MSFSPILFAIATWFLSTAAIVWLDSRARSTFRASFLGLGAVALIGVIAIAATRDAATPANAYVAFASAIAIWGWHEFAFLAGICTGPRRDPLPPGVTGWARFRLATATVIHHEVALAATLALIALLTWGAANQAALWAFGILFALRLSAKLNLFLGVANLSDEVFPVHLAYLKSYFGPRPVNPLYPVSLLLAGGLAAFAWTGIADHTTSRLAATLAALGLVEHLFLVLPLKDSALWRWAAAR